MRARPILLLFLLVAPLSVAAQDRSDLQARAALEACLDKAKGKGETCVGTIRDACFASGKGGSEAGNRNCIGLETDAWDERLNAAYRKLLAGELGEVQTQRASPSGGVQAVTGADILREAQRAWIAFRDKKCDAARLPMEGGTGAMTLEDDCQLYETARQALWLENLARNP